MLARLLLALALLWPACAYAQEDLPNHSMPIGTGPGVVGWRTVGPCNSNVPIVGAGATSDPICFGGTIATLPPAVANKIIYWNAGATIDNLTVGTGLSISGASAGSLNCGQATNAAFGCVEVDGTTITASGGVISAVGASAALVVGTTTISSGTSGRVEYNNAGVLGEYSITGTGNVVMSASPTLSGTVGGNLTWSGNQTLSGTLTAASLSTVGTIAGSLCQTSGGLVLYESGINCFSTTATSITVGTTTIASGTTNGLIYDNAGVVGNLATANNGVLITSGGGVPSISSTIPAATQANITGTGTLTSGATGAGFTIALTTSTVSGDLTVTNGGTGLTTLTSNTIYKGNGTGALAVSALTDNGTNVLTSEPIDLTSKSVLSEIANASSTGTTVNKLAKLTGAPSTAVIAATTDTSGIIGIVVDGAGTSSNAQIAVKGQASCIFDGATTAGDYVQISGTTAGDCHDTGAATYPASGQVLGRVLSTNASGGTYNMTLFGAEIQAGGGGTGITGVTLTAGTGITLGGTCVSSTSISCTINTPWTISGSNIYNNNAGVVGVNTTTFVTGNHLQVGTDISAGAVLGDVAIYSSGPNSGLNIVQSDGSVQSGIFMFSKTDGTGNEAIGVVNNGIAGSETFNVSWSGKTVIGIGASTNMLDVYGTGSTSINVHDSSGIQTTLFSGTAAGIGKVGTVSATNFALVVNNTEYARMTTSGVWQAAFANGWANLTEWGIKNGTPLACNTGTPSSTNVGSAITAAVAAGYTYFIMPRGCYWDISAQGTPTIPSSYHFRGEDWTTSGISAGISKHIIVGSYVSLENMFYVSTDCYNADSGVFGHPAMCPINSFQTQYSGGQLFVYPFTPFQMQIDSRTAVPSFGGNGSVSFPDNPGIIIDTLSTGDAIFINYAPSPSDIGTYCPGIDTCNIINITNNNGPVSWLEWDGRVRFGNSSTGTTGVGILQLADAAGLCDIYPAASPPLGIACSSDAKLKKDIVDTGDVLADFKTFRVRDFTWKASGQRATGVIAQELELTHPDMVRMGSDNYLQAFGPSEWKIVRAIQELQSEIDELKGKKHEIRHPQHRRRADNESCSGSGRCSTTAANN